MEYSPLSNIFPRVEEYSGKWTDLKFRARGARAPTHNIVLVAIDDHSLTEELRWPWSRSQMAALLEEIAKQKPKAIGFDIVFSEKQFVMPPELRALLDEKGFKSQVPDDLLDQALAEQVGLNRDKVVLGFRTDQCSSFRSLECPGSGDVPPTLGRFAAAKHSFALKTPEKTAMWTGWTGNLNLPILTKRAKYAGHFNARIDADGVIRSAVAVVLHGGQPYGSLAVEVARAGLKDHLSLEAADGSLTKLEFNSSKLNIPVRPNGEVTINYRGPEKTFRHVSALDIMTESPQTADILKDAYVIIGATAPAIGDIRSIPFDPWFPGPEIHANILDNVLAGDFITPSSNSPARYGIALAMALSALLLVFVTHRLAAKLAFSVFIGATILLMALDLLAFSFFNFDLHSVFFWIEWSSLFAFLISFKFIEEQRERRKITATFGRYLAPDLVAQIVADPSKIKLGGERKLLTIMFSDIRGFTEFSERMEAQALSKFLNDYLGRMTDIVFESRGTLDKYIGDAVMAFWGAPLDVPDHSLRALKATIQMVHSIKDMKAQVLEKYGVELKVGIGVHTGEVSVGNMGSERNMEYTVIGDHVNLTSRLEGVTKEYGAQILTTRATIDEIKKIGQEPPPNRVLDLLRVKGKAKPVEIIEVMVSDYPLEAAQKFQSAREAYFAQNWPKASAEFKDVARAWGRPDAASELFLERIEHFIKNPPGPDWDGVWKMTTK
ncbi:MAG: adenylate/guanylate cyclase domain-containing protein [Bdellovibrionia bacterium]